MRGCGDVGQRRMGRSNRELGAGSLQREWGWGRSQGQRCFWGVKGDLGLLELGWGVAKKRKGVGEIWGV